MRDSDMEVLAVLYRFLRFGGCTQSIQANTAMTLSVAWEKETTVQKLLERKKQQLLYMHITPPLHQRCTLDWRSKDVSKETYFS